MALGDHPDTARSVRSIAQLCFYDGRLPEAAALTQDALAIYEAALGTDHPETETARSDLALFTKYLGRVPTSD